MTVLIALGILGGLILAHEMGHFLAAKLTGVKVKELGIGYPPRLLAVARWKGTDYTLNVIPFGGFVRLPFRQKGAREDFAAYPKRTRLSVLLAGPAMNFLLAVLLFSLTFQLGVPVPSGFAGAEITKIVPGSPAERAGLQVGDIILEVDGEHLDSIEELNSCTGERLGEEVPLLLERGEELMTLVVIPRRTYPRGQGPLGIVIQSRPSEIRLYSYSGWQPYIMGLLLGLRAMVIAAALPLLVLLRLLPPDKVQLTGPVGVVMAVNQAIGHIGTTAGLFPVLQLTAVINIGLVVGNLLPLPALDGGHIFLLLLEAIRGRRLSPTFERRVHLVGFALLVAIMIAITYSDLTSGIPPLEWP